MKLENLNPAKRDSKVTVNGNTYWIGHGGFVDDGEGNPIDVPETDASKLMQGRAWKALSWDPDDPRNAKRMMPAPTGIGIGRRQRTKEELKWDQGVRPKTPEELGGQAVTVPTKDGQLTGDELVESKPPTTEEIQKAHADDVAAAQVDAKPHDVVIDGKVVAKAAGQEDTGLLNDTGQPMSGTETTREIETMTADTAAAKADSSESGEETEWPDPTMKMTGKYLREIADAYEVSYNEKTTKKELVKTIMKAMY